jgi:hypothetical protein
MPGNLTNLTPIVTATANALLASTVVSSSFGITTTNQMWYGFPVWTPSSSGQLPALTIIKGPMRGSRQGMSGGHGTTAYSGQVDVIFYVAASTDIGTLEGYGEALIDDLIDQGGAAVLNIIAVEPEPAEMPNPDLKAGSDSTDGNMAFVDYCMLCVHLTFES